MGKNDVTIDFGNVVVLGNQEVVLKTFEGFDIVSPHGKGYFTITTQRLIYYASSRDKLAKSITVRECPVDLVGEIAAEYGKRTNRLQKAIGLILLFIGLGLLGYGVPAYLQTLPLGLYSLIGGGVFFLVGLIVTLTAKRKMFTLEIFTRSSRSSIVSLTSDFFQSPNRGRIKIKPTNQTIQMIKELGMHIMDAKNRRHNVF
jgi:hypothetical protein